MPPIYKVPRTKACQNCAAAKVKCEPGIGYTRCKRCNAQNLPCVVQVTESRKRKRVQQSTTIGEVPIPNRAVEEVASTSCRLFEIECGMHYYRTSLFEFFPFIIMPDVNQSAADFGKAKPFLALVVAMLGCTKARMRQRELIVHIRAYVATHMVQNGEKSLGLLQGLLLLIHWSHLQLELRGQRSLFMHIAMSLLVDLQLSRSPLARRHFVTATEECDEFEIQAEYHAEKLAEHTSEERRAFLACIYLSSVLSNTSINLGPVQFNEYAEQCCDVLERNGVQTDRSLTYLCRLQHSVQQFRIVTCWFNMTQRQRQRGRGYKFIYNIFRETSSTADILNHVRTWDAKISGQWNAIPESVKTRLSAIQYGYARVCLYECCLEEYLFQSPEDRHEVLRNCISAIRSLNDALVPISVDPLTLLDTPAHIFAQSNHNAFLALLLCSIKCGDNSTEVVDCELKLRDYFSRTADRLATLFEVAPEDQIPHFYKRLLPMARGIHKWFAIRLGNVQKIESEKGMNCMPGADLDASFWDQFLNLEGDQWLEDVLAIDCLDGNMM